MAPSDPDPTSPAPGRCYRCGTGIAAPLSLCQACGGIAPREAPPVIAPGDLRAPDDLAALAPAGRAELPPTDGLLRRQVATWRLAATKTTDAAEAARLRAAAYDLDRLLRADERRRAAAAFDAAQRARAANAAAYDERRAAGTAPAAAPTAAAPVLVVAA